LIKRSIEVKPVEDLEEDAEPEYIGEGIMEGFTLKKALVYTEIIERRY
jgi:TolB-like protein